MPRPIKPADPTEQAAIGLRVPGALKSELEKAAAAADRSLSQEAERRLRRSFEPGALIEDAVAQIRDAGFRDIRRAHEIAHQALTLLYGKEAADTASVLFGHLQTAEDVAKLQRAKAMLREIEAKQKR
jgi:hypothetical protein